MMNENTLILTLIRFPFFLQSPLLLLLLLGIDRATTVRPIHVSLRVLVLNMLRNENSNSVLEWYELFVE